VSIGFTRFTTKGIRGLWEKEEGFTPYEKNREYWVGERVVTQICAWDKLAPKIFLNAPILIEQLLRGHSLGSNVIWKGIPGKAQIYTLGFDTRLLGRGTLIFIAG